MAGNSPTVIVGSLNDDELKKSIDKLVNHVDTQLQIMVSSTKIAVDSMNRKLKTIGQDVTLDLGTSLKKGVERQAKELSKTTQESSKVAMTYDQIADATQRATQSASKYSEEVRKQAEAIRATKQWQEKGFAVIGDTNYYDPARSTVSKNAKKLLLSLEEQIVQATQKRAIEEQKVADATQKTVTEASKLPKQGYTFTNEMLGGNADAARRYEESKKKAAMSNETFQQSIARLIGVESREINLADTSTDSYTKLSRTLKQLETAYNQMSASERGSDNGKALVSSMLEIRRAIAEIQRQKGRPVSLEDILAFTPKTLDQMADKLRELKAYRGGIDITKKGGAEEIKRTDKAIKELTQDMNKYMMTSKEMQSMNNALARSFNYMKNRLAFYFTVGASTAFVKNLIDIRAQYEMNERALGILINSAERGTQIFQELSQMALVSPYTLIELSTAAKQLTAYDVAARDVVDTTRRLADMAAAVGIPIERLTYALGQIKAYGYLNARDARMFSNAGIPLVKQLSEYYTELEGKLVSTADVYDRIKKKAIGYNDVMQVVNKMTDEGGKFFDFQAKMATTLKVQLANLTLAWNNMLNDIGQSEQGMLSGMIGLLKNAFLQWKNINRIIEDLAITFGVVKVAQFAYYGVVLGTNKAIAAQAVLGTKLTSILKTLGGTMNQVLTSGATWWGVLAAAATGAVISIIRGNEAMKEFNKSLREDATSTYDELSKFLNQYQNVRDSLYKTNTKNETNDIDKNEALKAWESVREQIELSSKASSEFVGKLLAIENVSERLRQGFKILDDIQTVTAALKELGDEGIKLERSWSEWWNLGILPDGTIENLKDSYIWLDKINDKFGSLENARVISTLDKTKEGFKNLYKDVAEDYIENYEKELEKFRKDLSTTTQSVVDFINLKGWQGDETKIEETFRRAFQNIALKNNLSPQQAMTMQLEAAQAEYNAIQNALQIHINDEQAALSKARDENERADIESRLKVYKDDLSFMQSNTAQSRVYWEDFTKWMGEQHKSEVQAMFKGQSAEQIKMLDFSRGEYNKWVVELAQKYAKEHGMSYKEVYDQLHNYILNANQWSIRIPLIISTQAEKSVYETLTAADTAIDAAYKKIQRLQTRQAELNKKGGQLSSDEKVAKESEKIVGEIADAQRDYNKALEEGGHSKKEDAAAKKAQKQAESELQKALKEEIQLIDKVRSAYKQLTKDEMNRTDAIALATSGLEESVQNINKVLGKYGLQLDLSKFAGITNPNEMVDMLNKQINVLMKTGAAKPAEIQDLQLKIKDFKLEAGSFNQKLLVDSLNSELGKLKEEYELAVSLEADPELGYAFADMMGVNMDSLPRTVQEYADEYTRLMNKYLAENKAGIELPNLDLTDDDLKWFEQMVKEEKLNEGVYKRIVEAVKEIRSERKKDLQETMKDWSSLVEKYGNLQNRITKIYKESVKEQVGVVRKFGTKEEESAAMDISDKIMISDDPEQIARLQAELAELLSNITKRNPKALEVAVAIGESQKRNSAKAVWEDFKNSDMYATTFENMAYLSIASIEKIIAKLEELKDKVKEDPASMKALIGQLEQAQNEISKRDPFKGIVNGLNMIKSGAREAKAAKADLEKAQGEVKSAEADVEFAKNIDNKVMLQSAEERLTAAIRRQEEAEKRLRNAENQNLKGTESLKNSLEGLSAQLGVVSGVFGSVSSLFRSAGMDETADAIDSINTGFTVMATVISLVNGVLTILESSNPWLLAIAASLSVIVGLVSFLSGGNDNEIVEEIEESQRAVKNLEIAYKNLEVAIEHAYGVAKYGAEQAALANKKLQIIELKRQLYLERSRDSKHRDEDRILDLRGQIVDLENEIKQGIEDITNDLLGITSVGSAAEELVNSMIEAFKKGEDYMQAYEDSFEKMIDNIIMKAIVSRVVGDRIQQMWDLVDQTARERGSSQQQLIDAITEKMAQNSQTIENLEQIVQRGWGFMFTDSGISSNADIEGMLNRAYAYREQLEEMMKKAQEEYNKAIEPTPADVDVVRNLGQEWREGVKEEFEAWMKAFGIGYGEDSDKQLSSLQQGIQGVTEDTAGAIEAYLNGMSQQAYLRNDILVEIRDTIQSFDMDVQVAVFGQILLQLQASYQAQMAIRGMLEGWSNPSGQAVRVEMV